MDDGMPAKIGCSISRSGYRNPWLYLDMRQEASRAWLVDALIGPNRLTRSLLIAMSYPNESKSA